VMFLPLRLFPINDDMFPLHVDKTHLDFGLDQHKQYPVNELHSDILVRTFLILPIAMDR